MTKLLNLQEYNQYFMEDDGESEENELPCSQFKSQPQKPISDSQVLANMSLNLISNRIVEQKVHSNKYNSYRETQIPLTNSSSSSSSSSSSVKSPRSPYTQTQETTQMKRSKFLEDMMDSTNHEPVKQLSLDDSIDNLLIKESTEEPNRFFGLPGKVKELLHHLRGITSLYDWQNELLTEMFEMEKIRNLLYLSPTSGGKTLVAEILLLQCLLLRKKNVIFVMPFVSIVHEKVEALQPFGENLGFYVEEYAGLKGTVPPTKRFKGKNSLFVCTIEKAHSLINSLIETGRLNDEIGMVVADELHMIGDGPRGAIYEMVLSKAKFCGKKSDLQIVATTATLENKQEVADFLDAYLYERHFRPVELKEYIKLDKQVFLIDKSAMKNLTEDDFSFVKFSREISFANYTNDMKNSDADGLITLVNEIFNLNSEDGVKESCLIFCPSKKNCENVAQLLSKFLPSAHKQYKRELKLKLFTDLREQNGGQICPVLRQSLQFGIAYHHSGLTAEERQLIEAAYREGVLFLLTCTSTLAAGVNLPAKRVVIRAPHVGREFISSHQYRQMIGRAGRAGFNTCGESILMFQNIDRLKVYDLISGPMKRCESSIEFDSKSIRILVLSLISLKLTPHGFDILDFFKSTLFYQQKKEPTKSKLSQSQIDSDDADENDEQIPKEFIIFYNALNYLLHNKFIQINEMKSEVKPEELTLNQLYFSKYEITKLGMAAIKGGVDLDFTQQLFSDLQLGLTTMVLSNYLHLLYLCTPYELVDSLTTVDYDTYARKFNNLSEDEIKCAGIIGVSENFITKKRFQSTKTNKNMNEQVLKRFYMTLIIYELWKYNKSIWHVSTEFQLDRGFVQQIIQSSASFTSGVVHFCENIDELWPYNNLLVDLMKRLQFNCTQSELLPLMELDNVRQPRAQQLYNAGYTTLEIIAKADAKELVEKIKNLPLKAATSLIKSANRLIQEKIDLLQSEVDSLLSNIKLDY